VTHGAVRFLIRTLEAVGLVLLLLAAVLAWRLSQGALKLDAVAPYISSAFDELAPGFRFQLDDAEFKWSGFAGSPELTVRDVRVLNDAGAVIAALPSMQVRLSTEALKRGIAAPVHVRLSNPIIRFVHRADGTLGLGVEAAAPAPAGGPLAPAVVPSVIPAMEGTSSNALAASLIGALTRAPGGDNPGGYLERVAIDATTVVLVDEVSGQRWLVPDAILNFARDGADVAIDATFPVIEEGRRWNLTAKGRYVAADGNLKIDVNVDGFRPSRVAGLAPQLAPFEMIDLRLSGTAAATLKLVGGGARLADLQFDVQGQDGQIRMPAPVSQDYPIKSLTLKGNAGADLDRISIEQFRVELVHRGSISPVIIMKGEGKALNSAPEAQLSFTMAELPLAALKAFWPAEIKPNTRIWINDNLHNGGVYNARFDLRLAGPTMEQLDATEARLSADLRDVSVRYMRSMPEVVGTDGRLSIGGTEVVIDVAHGDVPDSISGRGLDVEGGRVRLYDLGSGTERADIQLKIVGGFADVMRVIDHEPLGYARRMGVDANSVSGEADVDLSLNFPLVKDLKFDQLEIGVKAATRDVMIPNVAFNMPLESGRLTLSLDRAGMDVTGSARLGDIQTTVDWRENFGGGDFRSRYVLDPLIGNDDRPKVGLGAAVFLPPYIDGVTPARVVYTVNRDETRLLQADVDLTVPAMAVPELGWTKEAGVPASGKVEVRFIEGRLDTVPSFRVISGEDFEVVGNVIFAENGRMDALTIESAVVGETKLAGKIEVDEVGGYSVDVAGPTFNSTYFWRELNRDDKRGRSEDGENSFSTPLQLRAKFDRMWLSPNGGFTDIDLTFERDFLGIQNIDFTSKVEGAAPFTFSLASSGDGRKFKGVSADGGAVVRAVGLFGDIVGGTLEIDGEFEADGTVKGLAQIRDFKLIDAPVLARLLSVASLTGIVDELRGDGISFKTLRAPFSYANATLSVKDGEMYGSSLGLTGAGNYTFASSAMDFEGTLIPAYSINTMLNSIPLVGALLSGGEKGGGIFAATYTYRGNVATAQPSVNPLAALAPGFLRHIFDIFKPGAPQEARVPAGGEKPATP